MPGPVLWAGTVRTSPLGERVVAAAAAGYSALSLSPEDYLAAKADGLSDADIRALVSDAGLRVNCYDPYTKWLPSWEPPPEFDPNMVAFFDVGEAEFFRAAEAVGASSMTVLEPFGRRWPTEIATACLQRIAQIGADAGLAVNLEFIPFWGIPDLATAWELVRLADQPNLGLVVDTWHYFRGRPDDELLASIPGDRIGAVQVSDASSRPVADLMTDCLHHRVAAGDGAFPLQRVLTTLRRTGGLRDVGPEIFSDAFDGRPAAQNAGAALVGLDGWLDG